MSDEQERAITLAGARLDRHRSICAFFHSQDREDQVLCPPDEFLKELSRRTK